MNRINHTITKQSFARQSVGGENKLIISDLDLDYENQIK